MVYIHESETASPDRPVGKITIYTDNRDFDKSATILYSNDGRDWQAAAEALPLFDYSQKIDLRNTDLVFPAVAARFFKIRIRRFREKLPAPETVVKTTTDSTDEADTTLRLWREKEIRINRVQLFLHNTREVENQELTRSVEMPILNRSERGNKTILLLDGQSLPIDEITFSAATPAYEREATIEAGDNLRDFTTLANGSIYRFRIGGCDKSSPPLAVRRSRWKYYRITIDNHEDRPLDFPGVKAREVRYEIISDATRGPLTILYAGATQLKPPRYDLEKQLESARPEEFAAFVLSKASANPEYQEPSRIFNLRNLVIFAVVLALTAIGGTLYAFWRAPVREK